MVSPYSWTYPGGVTRHIESLGGALRAARARRARARAVRPRRRLSRRLHRGARPQRPDRPRISSSLGRTVGFPANGAVSNVARSPRRSSRCARSCATAATTSCTSTSRSSPSSAGTRSASRRLPLVGTFHTYSENALTNGAAALLGARRRMNRLHARIAVSEAAAWTARRFFGGRYRIVPNGVDLDADLAMRQRLWRLARPRRARCASCSSARRSSARACPCCCARSRRCASMSRRRSRSSAPSPEEVAHMMLDDRGVRALGKVSDARKLVELRARRRPVRALAARRELRHGPHRGVRRRHAGRRLRHPRLPRRRARRHRRRARAARRRARPGRGAARARARPSRARRGWPPPRASAPSASPGRTSPPRCSSATSRRSPSGAPLRRSPASRVRHGLRPADLLPRCPPQRAAEPGARAAAAAPGPRRLGSGGAARALRRGALVVASAVGLAWRCSRSCASASVASLRACSPRAPACSAGLGADVRRDGRPRRSPGTRSSRAAPSWRKADRRDACRARSSAC